MLSTEKLEIAHALQAGRTALGEALAGVDPPLARRKPARGGWSILECVEHVAVSEWHLLAQVRHATPIAQPLENPLRESRILERGVDRSRPVVCPEPGLPANRFATVQDALADFDAVRAQTLRNVEEFSGDPRSFLTEHPVIPGPVNLVEMWLTMAVHPARHALQIHEIRDTLASRAKSSLERPAARTVR
jgi:DinB superfamily